MRVDGRPSPNPDRASAADGQVSRDVDVVGTVGE
jgi:hypothetical protein